MRLLAFATMIDKWFLLFLKFFEDLHHLYTSQTIEGVEFQQNI